MWRKLGAKGRRPMLQKRFTARIGGEEGRRKEAGKGAHGQDQPILALDHRGYDQLREAQRSRTIRSDDGIDLGLGRFRKTHRNIMANACAIDQYGNVLAGNRGAKGVKVSVRAVDKVNGDGFGSHGAVHVHDFLRHGIELALRPRDEQDVEALGGQLQGEFAANAVRAAGHDGPAAFGPERAELGGALAILFCGYIISYAKRAYRSAG